MKENEGTRRVKDKEEKVLHEGLRRDTYGERTKRGHVLWKDTERALSVSRRKRNNVVCDRQGGDTSCVKDIQGTSTVKRRNRGHVVCERQGRDKSCVKNNEGTRTV